MLLCASVLLISRSFYVIYVRGHGGRATRIITWCSLLFMVGFWTIYLTAGVW